MPFEKYEDRGRRSYAITATICRTGQINFSAAAVRKYNINAGHCCLYFDRDRQLIGVETGVEQGEGCGTVSIRGEASFRIVSAKNFLRWAGIDMSESRTYQAAWSDEHQMLIIDLSQSVENNRNNKPKKKRQPS